MTDLVYIIGGGVIGLTIGLVVGINMDRGEVEENPDNDECLKQEIFDGLVKLKADIEKTV